MVLIGGARINENGTLEGGKYGDQSGKECMIEPWYLHEKGWYVIRPKDKTVGILIAKNMRAICENNNIGYSYWEHCYGLYNESKQYGYDASKVKTPCDTNCAKAVWVCALYAKTNVADFNTGNEIEKFLASKQYDVLKDDKYCKGTEYLRTGDILVTRTKGHTVVVLNDGKTMDKHKWKSSTSECGYYILTGNAHVRKYPSLNAESLGVLDKNGEVFSDGITVEHEDRVWYHVCLFDSDGTEGFISGKLMKKMT